MDFVLKNMKPQKPKENKRTSDPRVYFKVPYLGETATNKMRNLLNKCNLPVKINPIFITEPPLNITLRPPKILKCPPVCICHNKNSCLKKNNVYQITCEVCSEIYVGKSHRTLHSRVLEHSKQQSSSVYLHFLNNHRTKPILANISTKILASNFSDSTQRKSAERIFITKLQPKINITLTTR